VLKKEEQRVTVFRRAAEAWRNRRADLRNDIFWRVRGDRFIQLFQWHWTLLPATDAHEIAREIVRTVLDESDNPMNCGYGDGLRISSSRENSLFEILHVLRHLDPPLADSLIAGHAQLAASTLRYPNGLETVWEEAKEAEERRKEASS
jgi:hypothetical protein